MRMCMKDTIPTTWKFGFNQALPQSVIWALQSPILYLARELIKPYPHLAHLAVAGPIVTDPGGYPIAEHDLPSLTVKSTADAGYKTGKLLDLKVDLVKIALESRYGEGLDEKHAAAIVAATHERGKQTAAHLGNLSDLENALALDVDSLHHMIHEELPEATIQKMVTQDILWVPYHGG